MPTVKLGNVNPVDDAVNGNAVTTFHVPETTKRSTAVIEVASSWDGRHSFDPPEWVESTDELLAQSLADEFSWPAGIPDSAPAVDELLFLDDTQLRARAIERKVDVAADDERTDIAVAIRESYSRDAHECRVGRPDGWEGAE